eukprot:7201551-Prorocentrum_lima.AAC.1
MRDPPQHLRQRKALFDYLAPSPPLVARPEWLDTPARAYPSCGINPPGGQHWQAVERDPSPAAMS